MLFVSLGSTNLTANCVKGLLVVVYFTSMSSLCCHYLLGFFRLLYTFCYIRLSNKPITALQNCRDIGKDKDKCDGGEDEDGKEQNTPRGRKTANSQGRRKGRITTRSMANEAASVAAEEAPPSATELALPDPAQLSKPDSTQKAMKEPAKPQTPVASMDANKGKSRGCFVGV